MIGCRNFFRVDRAWEFINSCVIPKPGKHVKGCCCYRGSSYQRIMSGTRDTSNAMNQTKRAKKFTDWTPVCAAPNTSGECSVEDVKIQSTKPHELKDVDKVEVGSQVLEVPYGISNSISDIQNVKGDSGVVANLDYLAENALKDANENKSLEGVSVPSADRHSMSVQVGASLLRFIKGKGGATQKKIEDELGVKISFPTSKQEESIIIVGDSIETITKASEKIQLVIDEAVKSPHLDYSHFVSLPLAIHPELVNKLIKFQNSVLGNIDSAEENLDSNSDGDSVDDEQKDKKLDKQLDVEVQLKVQDDGKDVKADASNMPLISYPPKASNPVALSDMGIERSIFIKPKTFHLTVLMLKLWNKERVDAANAVLQSVSSKVMDALGGRPIFVKLKGLDCMRGSLAKARVLYAPVEEIGNENRLLQACQVIRNAYVEAGLVLEKDAQQKLKLHATIMNASHRKRKKRTRKLDSFDARGIFKQYGSEEWGEYLIREAHLSQRFVFDENGYYHCCASIPFPEDMLVD